MRLRALDRLGSSGEKEPSSSRWWGLLAAAVIAGTLLSVLAYLLVADLEKSRASSQFNQVADERLEDIERNIRVALSAVQSIHSFFASSSHVTRTEFQTFVNPLLAEEPALVAAFWAPRVNAAERAIFEQEARLDGYPEYAVLQLGPQGGPIVRSKQPRYFPVLYLQPTDLSLISTGLDLLSDALYEHLLNRAARTGSQAATRPLRIPGRSDALGYMVVQPVYSRLRTEGASGHTVENTAGFVGTVMNAHELLRAGPADMDAAQIHLVIYDTTGPFRALLWAQPAAQAQTLPATGGSGEENLQLERRLTFANRTWEITATPSTSFLTEHRPWISQLVLVLGLVGTMVSVLYALLLQARATQARRHARETQKLLDRLRTETEARSRMEEQLRQTQKLEAIGRLAGGVAHDFNNLLTVILGNTELLLLGGPSQPGQENGRPRPELEEIKKSAELAATLTQKLLAFSRRQPRQVKVFRLDEEVAGMKDLLQRLLGDHLQLSLTLPCDGGGDTAGDTGASTPLAPPLVEMDPSQLQQVLMNLVINAGDSMPEGGVIKVSVSTIEVDDVRASGYPDLRPGLYTTLEVTDSGHGMDAATLTHIFEPFFTTKEEGRGTGLGLATVYGIVKQNGGHIETFSTLGKGTTFRVYLPLARSA